MEQTIPKLMRKAAQKYPEITAQYSRTKTGDFEERNYHDMLQFALDFAGGLAELGVVRGEKIGLISDNRREWESADVGLLALGAIDCPRGCDASESDLAYILSFAEVTKCIVENAAQLRKLIKIKDKVPLLKMVICFDPVDQAEIDQCKASGMDFRQFYDVTASGHEWRINHPDYVENELDKGQWDELATIIFTSGTTGTPKSVVLTNKNIVAAGIYSKNDSKVQQLSGERVLVCVPFTYPYGFYTSTLTTLLSGKTAILAPDMSGTTIATYLEKEPNIIFGSPALIELIMRNTPAEQDLSSITYFFSGGDFFTPALVSQTDIFLRQHGAKNVEIGNGSGNAETCSIGTNPLGKKVKPDTAGSILVGTEAMIVDPDTMEQKKYNEEGMLCVSGKHVFKEYFGEPQLTAEVKFMYKGKEYFKTGTIGSIDEDGYFKITGRFSRFYIRSSLDKVYLDHVQGVISRFEPVLECADVKVNDKEQLFVNYAFVVLKDGWLENEETKIKIFDQCHHAVTLADGSQDQLKEYEIPQKIVFLKDLPRRSGTDKINYQVLEEMAKNV